jgi:hypothetical protein
MMNGVVTFHSSGPYIAFPHDILGSGKTFTLEMSVRIGLGSLKALLSVESNSASCPLWGCYSTAQRVVCKICLASGNMLTVETSSIQAIDTRTLYFALVLNSKKGAVSVYVDGVLLAHQTTADAIVMPTAGHTLLFGRYTGSASGFAGGFIDDLRVWGREVYDFEIAMRYAVGQDVVTGKLETHSYLPFDQHGLII